MTDELIIYFRLIERSILAIVFITISVALVWSYRKDLKAANLSAELNGMKVALPLAKPFVAALLLLGYVFVSLSHPVSIDGRVVTEDEDVATSSVRFFEERNISRNFTNLAIRDGGLDPQDIAATQRLVRLALRIEQLALNGNERAVSQLLANTGLSVDEIGAQLDEIGNKE